ncbi:hypothetical protein EYF80_043432 [Liparis tanakae]|uniref:Uncharacterized protein n=1 Tax=Liparis tanakae TaxID=230148 RepID=A0A4Z2G1H3_9TELE|nr:hypothetical protein EYF80_043432 [Liparis tanakae]
MEAEEAEWPMLPGDSWMSGGPKVDANWFICPSSRSSASWSSISRSRASSSLLCQSAASPLSRSHLVITSSASLRRTRPTFWARSSGLISEGCGKKRS